MSLNPSLKQQLFLCRLHKYKLSFRQHSAGKLLTNFPHLASLIDQNVRDTRNPFFLYQSVVSCLRASRERHTPILELKLIVRDVIWVQIFPVDFSYWPGQITITNFVSIFTQIVLGFQFFYAQQGGKGIFVMLD